MSIGIVSSKEGHDESHINDTKLGTKSWNIVDNVTIGMTQSTDTKHDTKLHSFDGLVTRSSWLRIMLMQELISGVTLTYHLHLASSGETWVRNKNLR